MSDMMNRNNKNLVIITGETDDDQIISVNEVNDDEIEQIIDIVGKIEKDSDENFEWPTNEYSDETLYEMYEEILTEDELDFLNNYIPYGVNGIWRVIMITVYRNISNKIYI